MGACFCSVAIFFLSGFLLVAGQGPARVPRAYAYMHAITVERWSSYDFFSWHHPSTLSFSFLFNA
jgi:hypothetical protein